MTTVLDADLLLPGTRTLLASWEAYANGSPGAGVLRLAGVTAAVFPNERERNSWLGETDPVAYGRAGHTSRARCCGPPPPLRARTEQPTQQPRKRCSVRRTAARTAGSRCSCTRALGLCGPCRRSMSASRASTGRSCPSGPVVWSA
jgi:hypothetical protein